MENKIVKSLQIIGVSIAAIGFSSCANIGLGSKNESHALSVENSIELDKVLSGPQRIDSARDKFRHPKETLAFFGVKPNDRVLEIWPGQGWYSSILGPYLKTGGGEYIAALSYSANPSEQAIKNIENFKTKFSNAETFGKVGIAFFGAASPQILEANSIDKVLTFRNIHNWMGGGFADKAFSDFYAVLKPGGYLGVVEHRAKDNVAQDLKAADGYVREDYVIELAQKAGFKLVAKSNINANPKDTKDHPFGVWTLPPVLRTSKQGQPPNIEFDSSKYKEIGESDRMTLLFIKPN